MLGLAEATGSVLKVTYCRVRPASISLFLLNETSTKRGKMKDKSRKKEEMEENVILADLLCSHSVSKIMAWWVCAMVVVQLNTLL